MNPGCGRSRLLSFEAAQIELPEPIRIGEELDRGDAAGRDGVAEDGERLPVAKPPSGRGPRSALKT
jgi:hypothetical protein